MKNNHFRIVHYMVLDGVRVEIDPLKTNLPDRCKKAMAEIKTGNTYKIVSGS